MHIDVYQVLLVDDRFRLWTAGMDFDDDELFVVCRDRYHKAAAGNSAGAMLNIGGLYRKGLGVAQDLGQALAWYRLFVGALD